MIMSQKRSSSQLEIMLNPQIHIHMLPVEILTKIFKECCKMEVYLYKGVPAPLILARVCRNWHRILIGGPIIPSPRRVTSSSTPLPLSFTSTPTSTPTPTLALTPTATPTTVAALRVPPFQPWQYSPNPRLWSRLEFTLPSIDSEDPHRLFPPPHVILNRISRYLALSSRPPISSSSSPFPSPCSPSPFPSSSPSALPPVPLDITIKNGAARGPCDSDPIEMYAKYPVRDDPYPEEILDLLDAHMERIERLSMQVPWGWVWRWGRRGGQRRTTNQALLLKSFSISITNDFPYPSTLALSHPHPHSHSEDPDSDPDPGFLPILRTASNLTSLALRAWSGEMLRILDSVPVRWERLVDLELKMVGARETRGLMEMLREGRRLERVRVVVDEWSGDGDELEGGGGGGGGATTPWVLPRLKVLEIEFLRRVCTERFLEPFAFPRLEELVIKHEKNSWGGGDMGGTLVGLMRRSHGSMWCGDSGGGSLEEEEEEEEGMSTPMPMVTTTTLPLRKVELRFNQSSELSGRDLVEFVSGVSDTLTHLECSSYVEESATLLDALTASDEQPVVIAPNLRELGIRTGKYRQEEVDRLWEFIKSRWSEEEDDDGDHQNDNDSDDDGPGVENTVNSQRLTVPLHHFRLILTQDISPRIRRSLSWQNILLRTRNGRDRFVFQEKPRTSLEQGVHCQPRALSRGDTFDNLDCDTLSELEADKFWKGVGYSISRARGRNGMRKGARKLGDCYYEESIASTTSTSSRASTPVASGSGGVGYGPTGESVSQPVYWTQSQSQSQTSSLGLGRRDSEISFTSLFSQERSRSRSVSRALALSREGTEEDVLTPRHDTGAPSRVGSSGSLRRSSTTSTLDLEFWNH
ncbi:hypothetical protein K435DRAFT_184725 [Dendrothele bispora CBS 962.96]|uniref:F-box domain-containing protein n=1 Tax=Dendrothele bispora (strain CBS 962.96) TaxID=1314807 RepID=A0A4S8KL70_DENBC|nr:hypothetical protein K435DRAFT_184725 [Dendrothele bispora CBS 962.96]